MKQITMNFNILIKDAQCKLNKHIEWRNQAIAEDNKYDDLAVLNEAVEYYMEVIEDLKNGIIPELYICRVTTQEPIDFSCLFE